MYEIIIANHIIYILKNYCLSGTSEQIFSNDTSLEETFSM